MFSPAYVAVYQEEENHFLFQTIYLVRLGIAVFIYLPHTNGVSSL